MSVYWLIPAQDQLQDALAQSDQRLDSLAQVRDQLSSALEQTFAGARAIMVIERINGYTRGMKNHVLRVEYVDPTGQSHAAIVKFSSAEKLAAELSGWESCARSANTRGVVLMSLRKGIASADGQLQTLVYEDARQTLRAARLVNLEDAFLTCCRWNDPECSSVEHVLDELFLELRKHLYQRARAENDPTRLADHLLNSLDRGISAWRAHNSQQEDCRQKVMTVLPGSVVDLLDPLDYLTTLLNSQRHLPEVMRGCVHGDLHGRNVLVGIDEEKATFVAAFDYEHMGTDQLVGWDLAKLETELKVRAYVKIFAGEETDFIQNVYQFEQTLAEETLKRSKDATWGIAPSRETPAERLFALLVAIRGRARECLAFQPERNNSWLHEYYFFLAAYGLYTGRFHETYGRRHFLCAYISAAAASAQHAWSKNASDGVIEKAAKRAELAIHQQNPHERLDIENAESFHVPFAFAREFCRSRDKEFITASIEILEALRKKFSYVVEIWQELALAHLELLDLTRDRRYLQEAKSVLYRLKTLYPHTGHYEALCRQGRLWKDCGDYSFDDGDLQGAMKDYQESLETYLIAYRISKHYYPGINVATLYLLAGQPDPSLAMAQGILAELDQAKSNLEDDLTWTLATYAEAKLLTGLYEDAMLYYDQAAKRADCKPHHRSAMLKQARRILRVMPVADPGFDLAKFEKIFD
jgi:hypothetical protein